MSATVDDEIRAVQERIAFRRMDLSDAGAQLAGNLKVRVASPRVLLIAAAGGFVAGLAALRARRAGSGRAERPTRERRLREGRRRTDRLHEAEEEHGVAPAAGGLGLLGMLAGWALTAARVRHGGTPLALARMVLGRLRRQ
jgi:hypothetical protein